MSWSESLDEVKRLQLDGRSQEAVGVCRDLLSDAESHGAGADDRGWLLIEYATLLHQDRRSEEARAALLDALGLGNLEISRAARYRLARVDLSDGDVEALQHLADLASESIDDAPGASALVTLADVERVRGDHQTAAALLATAIGSAATDIASLAGYSLSDQLAREDPEAAMNGLRRAASSPDRATSVRAASYLGPLLAEHDRLEEAVSVLSLATTSDDDAVSASAAVALGQVHLRLDNRPLARAVLVHTAARNVGQPSSMARRILFSTELAADGADLSVSPTVVDALKLRSELGADRVRERAALAREAAAALDADADAPLAGALWAAGADLDLEGLAHDERLSAIREALASALLAVQVDEQLFGEGDPQTAGSHYRLAQVRAAQVHHDPELNLVEAIELQERGAQALTGLVAAGGVDFGQVAMIKNNLATLYMSRQPEPTPPDVARSAELLEQALDAYRLVLGENHQLVFNTLGNLVGVQQRLHTVDAAEVRRAWIVRAEEALEQGRREGVPPEHLLPLLGNLGTLYQHLEGGDHGANTGRAIELAEEVRDIVDGRFGRVSERAITARQNLGTAYRWDHGPPLRAIAAFEEALEIGRLVWGPRGDPLEAQLLDSLANAYGQAAAEPGGPPGAFARALELHAAAVDAARRWYGNDHHMVADALMDQALTLRHLGSPEQQREAADLLEEAVRIRRSSGSSGYALANACGQLAVSHLQTSPSDVEAALAAASEALSVMTPQTAPRDILGLGSFLGLRLGEVDRWQDAARFFAASHASSLVLQDSSVLMRSQSEDARMSSDIAVNCAYAHVMCGQAGDALMCLEHFRAHWLRNALARDRADLTALEGVAPGPARAFRSATETLQALRRQELSETARITRPGPTLQDGASPPQDVAAEPFRAATAAQRAFEDALRQVRAVDGFSDFLASPSRDDLARVLAPGWAATYLATSFWGTVALTLWPDGHIESFRSGVRYGHLARLMGVEDDQAPVRSQGYVVGQLGDRSELRRALEAAAGMLGGEVLAPLAEHLRARGTEGVVVIACGALAALPLHGLAYDDDRCLLDDFDVIFAPSLQILREMKRQRRGAIASPARFVGVASPPAELRYASSEVDSIAQRFEQPSVLSTDDGLDVVLESLGRADFAHLACHASYEPAEMLDSYFQLGGEQRLRVRDLLSRDGNLDADLVVASACQSAMTAWHPDEAMTLSGAFIHAGARAAVGTLWSVNDRSTALLTSRFYSLVDTGRGGLPPWSALRQAQLWLRDTAREDLDEAMDSLVVNRNEPRTPPPADASFRPLSHPYHWAPFICTGAP